MTPPSRFSSVVIKTGLIILILSSSTSLRYDRMPGSVSGVFGVHRWGSAEPKIHGKKLSHRFLYTSTLKVQKKIVTYHNMFRSRVKPEAGNMLNMKWYKSAAHQAQKWASSCRFLEHDSLKGRWVKKFGVCGQNIFIATQEVPWFFAIQTWFLERLSFTYGSRNNSLEKTGHYTQLVWASTHKVGCGFSRCPAGGGKSYFSYVCNYCPTGNHLKKLGRPYRKGQPCSFCPQDCTDGKLCSNACPGADMWSNCRQIFKVLPTWLCQTNVTPEGKERADNCRATCFCQNKIK